MNLIDVNNPHFYITIALSILNSVMLCFAAYKFLQAIQLAGYRIVGYFYWLKDTRAKYVSRLFMLSFLSICFLLVTNVLFNSYINGANYYAYISLIFYFYLSIIFILNMYSVPKKTPLKYTKRMTRLVVTFFILNSVLTFFLIAFFWGLSNIFNFAVVAVTPLLIPITVLLVHIIITPLEELIKLMFMFRAKKRLKKRKDLIKIGITGSFGKTSTKYILNTLLSQKYNVCMSPNSFNTPMGLTKVINAYLKQDHEVLIAEMGAKQKGEIKYLCNFVKPDHGILTAVGNQHLETFGSLETIKKTKYELIESLNNQSYAVFNADNKYVNELYKKTKLKNKLYVALNDDNAFVTAKNVKVNHSGSEFDIVIKGKNAFKVTTLLLGTHNIENILMAVSLSYKLGLTINQIKKGIKMLVSVPHRLELTKTNNGVTILDDSFNASIEGSKRALEVLKLFEAGKKIVMTPGLVELGKYDYEENFEFAKRIAKVADKCIVVNLAYQKPLNEGLIAGGFKKENIILAENLEEAKQKLSDILNNGDVLLIENDLPDTYT